MKGEICITNEITLKKIFLSTHNTSTTKEYISNIVKEISGNLPIACSQLRTKYDTYVSFCVTVTEANFNLLLDPRHWEEDFLIMPFEGGSKFRSNSQQTRRLNEGTAPAAPVSLPSQPAQTLLSTNPPNASLATNQVTGVTASHLSSPKNNLDDEISKLKRQNTELEQQLREMQTAWDADGESESSSALSDSTSANGNIDTHTPSLNEDSKIDQGANLHQSSEEETICQSHST